MMTRQPRIVAISGSVNRPSRSRSLAESVAAAASRRIALDYKAYDLVDAGPGLGAAFARSQLSSEAATVVEAIENADALIAVSPVYKGSYTGLFKHLFDFVSPGSLLGKPVVVGATGGGHRHGLVVEHQMRPLFGFFSALTIPTSVYASDREFEDGHLAEATVLERVELAAAQLVAQILARRADRPGEWTDSLRAATAA
jgi:FMN reductase